MGNTEHAVPSTDTDFSWEVNTTGYRLEASHTFDQSGNASTIAMRLKKIPGKLPKAFRDAATDRGFPLSDEAYFPRYFRPFDEPTLYRQFAGLAQPLADHLEELIGFADRWGPLTGQRTEGILLDSRVPGVTVASWGPDADRLPPGARSRAKRGFHFESESADLWASQSRLLGGCVRAWETLRDPGYDSEADVTGPTTFEEELLRPIEGRDYLRSVVSAQLESWTSVRLDVGETISTIVTPEGLLGVFWLQFADAMERDLEYRPCETCGKDFEIRDGRSRRRKYCSAACGQQAYRERKEG